MSLPGFTAEATLYRSTANYQVAWASGETASSDLDPVQPTLLSGRYCEPRPLGPCESNLGSATGCAQKWLATDCGYSFAPCVGCSNPCRGGHFCDGKCTNTGIEPNNCGACGNVCAPGVSCINGTCGCLPEQTLCGGGCADTNSDPNNCGGCGKTCGAGTNCVNGGCLRSCLVDCGTWQGCNAMCGSWPPGLDNYKCWLNCLQPSVDCLNSTCG